MSKLWRGKLTIINAVLFLGIWTFPIHSQVRRYVTSPNHPRGQRMARGSASA